jgi:type IV pilus assembly protein PilY1
VFFCKANCPDAAYGYTATPALSGFSPGAAVADMYRYEIKPANFSAGKYEVAIQNFANWFSYYRKRQLATRGGLAASFKDMTSIRAATFRINNRVAVTMRDFSVPADRDAFFTAVMAPIAGGGTPNREALLHAGEQFMRTNTGAPIQYACQANAAILFTDGFSNATTGLTVNDDGDQGSPYADSASGTMADIAMKYYKTPLRSGSGFPAGKVAVLPVCNSANPPNGTDCKKDLHMLTYGVTLGSKGILYDPDNPPDAYATPPSWWTGGFVNRSPRAVDDLWHATLNGRGDMLNARTPTEVAETIKAALSSIVAKTGSASAVATNSTRLDTGSYVYQAKFDSGDWSGTLLAFSLAENGQLDQQVWATDTTMPSAAERNIVTWTGTAGLDFTVANWASLTSAQRLALNNGAVDTVGQARLQWLRGSNANEERNGGVFRDRSKLLGDIVNSDPLFVYKEDYGFSSLPSTEGTSYSAFDKSARAPMLYVGGNDGMLHGFNANDGIEKFAFIPAGVYGSVASPKLAALSSPGYSHQYFVDGSARASDAYLGGAWKTVLLGSTGAGGKSVFAVDVTSPTSLGPSSVIWEYTTTGVTAGSPVIARLASGDWVAIFGNGYDSGENVKLNIVRLSDGVLLKAIDTGVSGTNNGLAPPLPVDSNNDRITDAVYAGDLLGRMWKFDVSSASVSDWDVAYSQSGAKAPLITVTDGSAVQPITARATAGRNPSHAGVMIYFGTGKYFESSDNVVGTSPQLQRFYGVLDDGAKVAMSTLVGQTVTNEGVLSSARYRVTSTTAVSYTNKNGWYLNLQSPGAANGAGERVVSTALLRAGRIIFSTLTPSADACDYGGKSWLMELDAINGARLAYSVFDFNGDGQVNDADFVTLGRQSWRHMQR